MPRIVDLSKLFQAIADGDLICAKDLAMKIAENKKLKGHTNAAKLLRGSLNSNKSISSYSQNHNVIDLNSANFLSSALTRIIETTSFEDMILKSSHMKELKTIIDEWKHRGDLSENGLSHRSKVFFYGPPGCGKSMAALAIGNELSLPTYVVRFDAIIGAYLGQTAIHLRELFRFAETTPCVLLLDEVDALGKKRGNPLDVGELDRIVISMMQELEHCKAQSIIIATSNLPSHLDEALWRRFDAIVEFPKPTKNELLKYAKKSVKQLRISLTSQLKAKVIKARSYAEAQKVIESKAKYLVLKGLGK